MNKEQKDIFKKKLKKRLIKDVLGFLKEVDFSLEEKIVELVKNQEKTTLFHYYYGKQAVVVDIIKELKKWG